MEQSPDATQILIVKDNHGDARLIREMMAGKK